MNSSEKLKIIKKTVGILNSGGIVLYPTDTIWGIGCDATNKNAIKKIYSIKKRLKGKPILILINNVDLLLNYVERIPPVAYHIIEMGKTPTTIIYENPINLPDNLIYNNTIGVRIVKNDNLGMLLDAFNKPLTSTSANISGNINPTCLSDIDNEIKNNVDYIVPEIFINDNTNKEQTHSIIIKINNNSTIQVVRE